jgi:hypothetical protein
MKSFVVATRIATPTRGPAAVSCQLRLIEGNLVTQSSYPTNYR